MVGAMLTAPERAERRLSTLGRVALRTAAVGLAGDATATRVSASIERESVAARLDREEAEHRATQLRRMAAQPLEPMSRESSVASYGGYAGERGEAEAAAVIARIRVPA
jgi:hypothetical protein